MAIKRRDVQQNLAVRDALLKSEKGQEAIHTVIQAKEEAWEIGQRIRQLKELVHSTFVSDVPQGFRKRFDVYQRSKSHVRDLGIQGGQSYDSALLKIKFAWTSRYAYKEAIESIAD